MQTLEEKDQDVYTNGSAGYMNGKEAIKMREVAFEKHPSEPMVLYFVLNCEILTIMKNCSEAP